VAQQRAAAARRSADQVRPSGSGHPTPDSSSIEMVINLSFRVRQPGLIHIS
jgi:hypothetical protein